VVNTLDIGRAGRVVNTLDTGTDGRVVNTLDIGTDGRVVNTPHTFMWEVPNSNLDRSTGSPG